MINEIVYGVKSGILKLDILSIIDIFEIILNK